MRLLNPQQSYTFSKIFELQIEADDFVAEFGYTLQRTRLNLPQYSGELDRLEELRSLLAQFENGTYPHAQLQMAWQVAGKQRRFSFHTFTDLMQDQQIIGRPQFLADTGLSELNSP